MIQFNLLPDIKLEFMRAERTKRVVVVVASVVTAVSLVIMLVLAFFVFGVQQKYIHDLTADITTDSKNLKATKDLDKILTVQNQLNSLSALHDQEVDTTRVFPFIKELTPTEASIGSLNINFDEQTMSITGSANSLGTINKFVDTLKFTNYKHGDTKAQAFSEVVLSSFGRADKGASYTITLKYDPLIFDVKENIELVVPDKVTTRSETEKPSALFEVVTGASNKDQ